MPEELARGLVERLEDLQRHLGRCEGRLKLSQVVHNLLRKQLQQESDLAARLEEKLREAEAALCAAEAARNKTRKGWFISFFGMGAAEG